MEYIVSQNAACRSTDGGVLTADHDDVITCQQQLPDPHHDNDDDDNDDDDARVHVSVKQTVEHLLGRLGLPQLSSLIDETLVSQSDTDTIQVRVIRPTQHHPPEGDDNDNDDGDGALRRAGESFALLLQLLRLCTNWNELTSEDASLSDALARLTEHEFTGGTMGYGVHTEKTLAHLANILAATENCEPFVDTVTSTDTTTTTKEQQQSNPASILIVTNNCDRAENVAGTDTTTTTTTTKHQEQQQQKQLQQKQLLQQHLVNILTATDNCQRADADAVANTDTETVIVASIDRLPNMQHPQCVQQDITPESESECRNVKVTDLGDDRITVSCGDDAPVTDNQVKYPETTSVDMDTQMIREIMVEMTEVAFDDNRLDELDQQEQREKVQDQPEHQEQEQKEQEQQQELEQLEQWKEQEQRQELEQQQEQQEQKEQEQEHQKQEQQQEQEQQLEQQRRRRRLRRRQQKQQQQQSFQSLTGVGDSPASQQKRLP